MTIKLLVIGSHGFIGRNAVKYFTKKGFEVHTADIVLQEAENYIVLNAETSDFSVLFTQNKYDVCINATGAANVSFSFKYPGIDFALNTFNVFNILEAIRNFNPECKFVNFSSAAVYGNPVSLPIKEDSLVNPLSPYGFHKYYSERICKEFYELYDVPTISLRVFSAYGEGLKKQLFWDIYQKISKTTEPQIDLFGTGMESRDFIYIMDLLRAVDLLIQKQEFNGQAINVSSGQETTIREAAEVFIDSIKPGIALRFTNETKMGDPQNWRADVTILNKLGFKAEFSLHDGLRNYANWLKYLPDND